MSPLKSSFNYSFGEGDGTPRIVTNGLVLNLDAARQNSYNGGTTWRDLSGLGNTGTLVNGVGYSSANKGSLSFDGVNDYVQTSLNYSLPSSTTEFTCSSWFRCSTQSTNTLLVSNYETTPDPFQLYVLQNGKFRGYTRNSSDTSTFVDSSTLVNDSKYHYVVYTKDSSNNYKLYIDLVLEGTTNVNLGAIIVSNNIVIGTLNYYIINGAPQAFFQGNIPQVSIYNRALSASEIQQNYNAMRGRFGI
jgi:hypothetical protein